MTRAKALELVVKLRMVTEERATKGEAANAKDRCARLCARFEITEREILAFEQFTRARAKPPSPPPPPAGPLWGGHAVPLWGGPGVHFTWGSGTSGASHNIWFEFR